jgi:hypothetical protein
MRNKDQLLLEDIYSSIYTSKEKESIFDFILENSSSNGIVVVNGPAIQKLIEVVKQMYFRGAPMEENDYGFNKGDYVFVTRYMDSMRLNDELPSNLVVSFIRLLKKYKTTQLPSLGYDYDSEYEEVKKALRESQKSSGVDDFSDSDEKIIIDHGNSSYGKVLVVFPSQPNPRKANAIVRKYCDEKGMQQEVNNFGKYDYPMYKVYQASKTVMNGYNIIPELAKKIAEELYPNVEIEERGIDSSVSPSKPKIKIVSKERTPYGEKLIINLGNNQMVSKKVYAEIKSKGLTPRYLGYQSTPSGSWRLLMTNTKEAFDVLKPYFEKELDISVLENHFAQQESSTEEDETQESQEDSNKYNIIVDYIGENSIKITTDFRTTPPQYKDFFKQAVKYIFPDYTWDSTNYKYIIKGDFEQYVMLGGLLSENFNVDKLREVFDKMRKEDIIKLWRKKKLKTKQEVDDSIDNTFNESAFKLYNLQKEGVEFLYKNKYAILGSETGGGKTVQMIYAAELVNRETNLPVLIITLKRVQKQFVDEIVSVMGEKEKSEISTDPMVTKKWNVLYYDNFSSGKNLDSVIRHLSSKEYSVIILDELHKVKHATAKRSKNIEIVSSKAKSRWGATATISANKPQDVRNQLAIIGHPIGKMSEGRFKKEFSGMVPEGYNGAYIENPNFEERLIAAENLNKWLHLSGVYIRHSKSDMRAERSEKMPDLKIDQINTDSIKDKNNFENRFLSKVRSYEDPDLAISRLLAYRDLIASEKTDNTIQMAIDIIKKNYKNPENNYSASKVLIFTNFRESGDLLLQKANDMLSSMNPKFKAYSFLSATPKKELDMVKKRMEDPNSKILVMSMKMGGTGISFPNTFKTMIVNDYDWTPESVEQSEGRIYRINTNQNVDIIYNINEGLDKQLYDKVKKKMELAKIIQTYRKIYQQEKTTSKDSDALKKIVNAQKEMMRIKEEEKELANKYTPTLKESFKYFFGRTYLF